MRFLEQNTLRVIAHGQRSRKALLVALHLDEIADAAGGFHTRLADIARACGIGTEAASDGLSELARIEAIDRNNERKLGVKGRWL